MEAVLSSLEECERLPSLADMADHVLLARLVAEREHVGADQYENLDAVLQELGIVTE
jgi:hypothetical protein